MLRKRVSLRPVLLMEITVIILLASIGVAVALNAAGTLKGGDYDVSLNYGTITDTNYVTVSDYLLTYNGDCSSVTGVTVYLDNSDTSGHTVSLTVSVGDGAWTTVETKTSSGVAVAASASSAPTTVTLDSPIAVTNLGRIHIYVEETA